MLHPADIELTAIGNEHDLYFAHPSTPARHDLDRRRQGEIERGAFIHLRLSPDTASVPCHHAPPDRQTHSGPRKLVIAVEALKHSEQLFVVLHVETRAVVLHAVHVLLVCNMPTHLD